MHIFLFVVHMGPFAFACVPFDHFGGLRDRVNKYLHNSSVVVMHIQRDKILFILMLSIVAILRQLQFGKLSK